MIGLVHLNSYYLCINFSLLTSDMYIYTYGYPKDNLECSEAVIKKF